MKSLLRRLGFMVFTTLSRIGALEIGLRLATTEDQLLYAWERSDAWLHVDTSGALWVAPNLHVRKSSDIDPTWEFNTNAQGFREMTDTPASRPADTYRMLALGDSWMFGMGVNEADTVPSRVERMVAEQKGWNIEIINAGVPGFRSWDMRRRWEMLKDRFEIDGVLLGAPHNEGVRAGDAESGIPAVEGPKSRLRTYLGLRKVLGRLRGPMYAEGPPDVSTGEADLVNLNVIATEARARGLDAWLLLTPANMGASLDPVDGVARVPDQWYRGVDRSAVWIAGHALDERICWHRGDIGHPSAQGTWALASALTHVLVDRQSTEPTWNQPRCSEAPPATPAPAPSPEAQATSPPTRRIFRARVERATPLSSAGATVRSSV